MRLEQLLERKISRSALLHNLACVRQKAPTSKIIAMIKANAYGHGLLPIAQILENQVESLGVARIDEALQLRMNHIKTPIILMEGVFSIEDLALVQHHDFAIIVHADYQLDFLKRLGCNDKNKCLPVWIKIDTGMHRLGFSPSEAGRVYAQLTRLPGIDFKGFMTHFSQSEASCSKTQDQIDLFTQAVLGLPGERSLANSGGILNCKTSHQDWVRPGIMLYGVSPVLFSTCTELVLQPVMTVISRIIAVRSVEAQKTIGYGGIWEAARPSRIATVAIGYGDGYPRQARNGTPVLIAGKRAPLVGRVSMDMITVDITDIPEAQEGSAVILWGEGLPIEEIAGMTDTIPYELFCRMNARVPIRIVS